MHEVLRGIARASSVRGNCAVRDEIRKTVEALARISTDQAMGCCHPCPPPDRQEVVKVIHDLQALLFPLAYRREYHDMADETLLSQALYRLRDQLAAALRVGRTGSAPASRRSCRRSRGFCCWMWRPCTRGIPPPAAGRRL